MADSKRSSMGGKVAMPGKSPGATTPTPASIPDTHEAITKAIGARIKLTTASPDSTTFEGTLYTADPLTNLIVLNTSSSPAASDYRVLPVSRIQTFQVLSAGPGLADPKDQISKVNTAALQRRAEDRVKALKEAESHRGRGVTREAQQIFDAFKRINMSPIWHGKEIIVLESVIVASPYKPEDCRAPREKMEALVRVKKALEGERRKLGLKDGEVRKGG